MALNEAVALAIAGELSLPALLQRIVDIARDLTRARYALGVTGEGGLAQFITSGISEEDRARIGPAGGTRPARADPARRPHRCGSPTSRPTRPPTVSRPTIRR
ncbi:MAG: hypothetical protein U0531_08495 [Dehalococcoidia bacterium]